MSDLRNVPGIGAKKEQDSSRATAKGRRDQPARILWIPARRCVKLMALGYDSLASLKDADPDELYTKACLLQNEQLDKCVLYAFRCAVAFAKDPEPNPNEYRWWHYTDEKVKG